MKRKGGRRSKPVEIFLSHATADRPFTDKSARTLRKHGLSVWYSRTHLVGAQQWHDEIGRALRRCDWFVVVLSKDAIQSKWVKRELMYALRSERLVAGIVPLLYRRCEVEKLSWVLPTYQIADFSRSRRAGYEQLMRIWGMSFKP
jgi:hypothetical protein